MRWFGTGLVCLVGLLLMACSPQGQGTGSSVPEPKVLRVGMALNDDTVERKLRFTVLSEHLAQKLGQPVEITRTTAYGAAIEAMRAGKLDVVSLGPFAYVLAHEKAGAVPLVCASTAAGTQLTYQSFVIVPADSPLQTLDDVVAQAGHLVLAWSDPASTSGHLVPRAKLDSLGVDAEKSFKRTLFSGSHLNSLLAIKAKKLDVAAVDSGSLATVLRNGQIKESDYRIVWRSGPITSSVIAMRGDYSAAYIEKVRQAFLSFPHERSAVWQTFDTAVRHPGAEWRPGNDADFDELRAMARSVRSFSLLD